MPHHSTQHSFPMGRRNTLSIPQTCYQGTINKRSTLLELHNCAEKAGDILWFCYSNFCRAFTGTLFPAPNECAVYWVMHRCTFKENDHQWCTLHLLPHFVFLLFSSPPSPPHLLTLSLSPSSALPLMRSIPYCSRIKTTLICVAGWNGMFDGFFSFPGWEGRVMC